MADGIAVGCPGEVPFALVQALVDDVVTVDEDLLARAMLFLMERAKQVAEPAGAAGVAALLDHPTDFEAPVVADVARWQYAKLLTNLANAIEAVSGPLESEAARELCARVRAEGEAVLHAAGIAFAGDQEQKQARGDKCTQVPLPGIAVDVVDEMGESVPNGHGGFLVIREPWPAMLRGIWGDPERFKDTYWSRFEDMYFAGDGAKNMRQLKR